MWGCWGGGEGGGGGGGGGGRGVGDRAGLDVYTLLAHCTALDASVAGLVGGAAMCALALYGLIQVYRCGLYRQCIQRHWCRCLGCAAQKQPISWVFMDGLFSVPGAKGGEGRNTFKKKFSLEF